MDRDRAIELQLPRQRSVGELGRERRLARLERPRGPERPVEGQVREGASLLEAEEHFRGDATRGRDRHGRLVTLRPTAVYRRRMPRRVAPTCKGRIQSCACGPSSVGAGFGSRTAAVELPGDLLTPFGVFCLLDQQQSPGGDAFL